MSTINIANRDDPFYRYKMPRVVSKIEGKGNGIKTVIPNMPEIAKALARDPAYPTKFFGFELGAQTIIDLRNNKYIVNGAFDAARLQEVMDKFIDKYVLCGKCGNPETDLIVRKDEIIRRCKACGKDSPTDKVHKCTAYIVKNPPPDSKKGKKNRGPKSPTESQDTPPDSPRAGDSGGSANGDDAAADGSDDELTKRITEEAAQLAVAEGGEDEHDEDWAVDVSPEAIAAREAELGVLSGSRVLDGDDEEEDSPLAEFSEYVRSNPSASDDAIVEHAKELYIKDYKALTVLPAALLHDATPEDVIKRAEARKALLSRLIRSEKGQKSLLGGFEKLFKENAALMPKVPIILKWVYDEDLAEEEVLLSWGEKASKKFVDKGTSKEIRKKAKPFLDWLQEAESDDDDE